MTGRATSNRVWCEHCRHLYPTDHYDAEGMHRHGPDFGYFGCLLACKDIVHRIAAGETVPPAEAKAILEALDE